MENNSLIIAHMENSPPIPLPVFGRLGLSPLLLFIGGVPQWDFEYLTPKEQLFSPSTMLMTREKLNSFENRNNVTKITNDNGAVSYLTQGVSFGDETYSKGACKLNTIENENKHVLFLFNSADAEVSRYYLTKSLQGKTPAQIIEQKHALVFFESFNEETQSWVPCVALSSQTDLASSALSF